MSKKIEIEGDLITWEISYTDHGITIDGNSLEEWLEDNLENKLGFQPSIGGNQCEFGKVRIIVETIDDEDEH